MKTFIGLYLNTKYTHIRQLISLLLLLACSYNGMCQDIFLGTSKDKVTNFYIISITHKGVLTEVFERVRPVDGKLKIFRKQVTDLREKENLSTDGFDKLGYYRRRIVFNCKMKLYQVREAVYYDLYGNEIKTNDPPPDADKTQWYTIPASTMREEEFIKACR